ncbi:MAG: aldo/keto reductase [Phycisphaerales bacterium]|nr:aldo/keto reductase [Phycisphaerales bacterium]
MRYNQIPRTDLSLSEIGFGCWTMGGPNWNLFNGKPIGWGDVSIDDVAAGLKAGLDAGVNHFDNADIYGNGRAERLLRDCLKRLGVPADRLVIATKVGWFAGCAPHAYTPRHIRNQCEQSLENLGVEAIDIYYFHNPYFADWPHPLNTRAAVGPDMPGNIADAAATMQELVNEGKVRVVGQSAYSVEEFERTIPLTRPRVLQSRANMLVDAYIRPDSRLQPIMSEQDIRFVAFGPLGQGLLLDKFDPDKPPAFDEGDVRGVNEAFTSDRLRALKPKMARIRQRFGDSVEDLASAAIRFVASHPNVASVIPGFRNERQARCNIARADAELMTEQEMEFCRGVFRA